eukprot:SAG22_NODE_498_length_9728_cov_12.354346_2_plen_184_part_00
MRCLSQGVLTTPQAYLGSVRGFFEFGLVVVTSLSYFADSSLRPLRALISLRLLYLVSRASVIAQTVGKTIPAVWTSAFMIVASFLVWGIMGVSLVGGKLWRCEPYTELDRADCEQTLGAEWQNQPYHFDDIFEAGKSLFIVWSMQGWTPIFFYCCDTTEVDMAPAHDANRWPAFAFLASFILW